MSRPKGGPFGQLRDYENDQFSAVCIPEMVLWLQKLEADLGRKLTEAEFEPAKAKCPAILMETDDADQMRKGRHAVDDLNWNEWKAVGSRLGETE
ncbi:hypothetical protein [Parvularcula maris]|uniref:Uncharacterized protein n=1 Tax=Parvularcula maris TaxID=2965077 RepID=A0A9X2L7Y4_9PROT|nr:hypothetical protein [Parvularcula maris]MCQ8184750.1 hypothetical protein [Parvularcula maris]